LQICVTAQSRFIGYIVSCHLLQNYSHALQNHVIGSYKEAKELSSIARVATELLVERSCNKLAACGDRWYVRRAVTIHTAFWLWLWLWLSATVIQPGKSYCMSLPTRKRKCLMQGQSTPRSSSAQAFGAIHGSQVKAASEGLHPRTSNFYLTMLVCRCWYVNNR